MYHTSLWILCRFWWARQRGSMKPKAWCFDCFAIYGLKIYYSCSPLSISLIVPYQLFNSIQAPVKWRYWTHSLISILVKLNESTKRTLQLLQRARQSRQAHTQINKEINRFSNHFACFPAIESDLKTVHSCTCYIMYDQMNRVDLLGLLNQIIIVWIPSHLLA